MTWHVWAQIVKDEWDQDGGWMMQLLGRQDVLSAGGEEAAKAKPENIWLDIFLQSQFVPS